MLPRFCPCYFFVIFESGPGHLGLQKPAFGIKALRLQNFRRSWQSDDFSALIYVCLSVCDYFCCLGDRLDFFQGYPQTALGWALVVLHIRPRDQLTIEYQNNSKTLQTMGWQLCNTGLLKIRKRQVGRSHSLHSPLGGTFKEWRADFFQFINSLRN